VLRVVVVALLTIVLALPSGHDSGISGGNA